MRNVFKVNKKTLTRQNSIVVVHLLGLNKFYTLFECFYGQFLKGKCSIGSISILIPSHIHNAANRATAKNICQSYFKIFEVFLSGKQQCAISTDWKTCFCIVFNFSSGYLTFDIFSTTTSSLSQYRKQMNSNYIFTYANWNINLIGNKEKQRYIDKSICLLATRFTYYPVRIIKPFYYL